MVDRGRGEGGSAGAGSHGGLDGSDCGSERGKSGSQGLRYSRFMNRRMISSTGIQFLRFSGLLQVPHHTQNAHQHAFQQILVSGFVVQLYTYLRLAGHLDIALPNSQLFSTTTSRAC